MAATYASPLRPLWRIAIAGMAIAGCGVAACIGMGFGYGLSRSFAVLLAAFACFKVAIALDALHRRRLVIAGRTEVPDPRAMHQPQWLFWPWTAWRLAAAVVALAAAAYLLAHPEVGGRLLRT